MLKEIRLTAADKDKDIVSLGKQSDFNAFDVVLNEANRTLMQVDLAKMMKDELADTLSSYFPSPPPFKEWQSLRAKQRKEAVRAYSRRLKKTDPPIESHPPKVYLNGWREVLDALELKNNKECRLRVRNFTEKYDGPIRLPKQGKQPELVDKKKLLDWWNGLAERYSEVQEENQKKNDDARFTTEGKRNFGKTGEVVLRSKGP